MKAYCIIAAFLCSCQITPNVTNRLPSVHVSSVICDLASETITKLGGVINEYERLTAESNARNNLSFVSKAENDEFSIGVGLEETIAKNKTGRAEEDTKTPKIKNNQETEKNTGEAGENVSKNGYDAEDSENDTEDFENDMKSQRKRSQNREKEHPRDHGTANYRENCAKYPKEDAEWRTASEEVNNMIDTTAKTQKLKEIANYYKAGKVIVVTLTTNFERSYEVYNYDPYISIAVYLSPSLKEIYVPISKRVGQMIVEKKSKDFDRSFGVEALLSIIKPFKFLENSFSFLVNTGGGEKINLTNQLETTKVLGIKDGALRIVMSPYQRPDGSYVYRSERVEQFHLIFSYDKYDIVEDRIPIKLAFASPKDTESQTIEMELVIKFYNGNASADIKECLHPPTAIPDGS